MTIEQFYKKIGGNYEEVLGRLMSEALVKKIALKFPSDGTMKDLTDGFAAGDEEKAFRAAHTMKGLCANLGFDCLYKPSYDLTEKLRGRTFDDSEDLFEEVKKQYAFVTSLLSEVE